MPFVGTASDEVDAILATGRSDVSRIFMSMSARHPEGGDAAYLEWHTLDHRPEQHRLPKLRASMRLVSDPQCRAARAASSPPFDRVDHVMSYFFADDEGFAGFGDLSVALRAAGRTPFLLPLVERRVYEVRGRIADPLIKAGADVLPWRPARGVYLIIGNEAPDPTELIGIPGVAGIWTGATIGTASDRGLSEDIGGQQLTFCFIDEDLVPVAVQMKPALERIWERTGHEAAFAGPFHLVVPFEWNRYLP